MDHHLKPCKGHEDAQKLTAVWSPITEKQEWDRKGEKKLTAGDKIRTAVFLHHKGRTEKKGQFLIKLHWLWEDRRETQKSTLRSVEKVKTLKE